MNEKPPFDPNRPFTVAPKPNSGTTGKPKFDPSKPYQETGIPHIDNFNPQEPDHSKTWDIIDKIPDLDKDKKDVLFDLAKKGASKEVISSSLGVLQGTAPNQWTGNYYLKNGVPVSLARGERPPKDYDIASNFGSKKDAQDDSWYTDLAKHAFNIIPGIIEHTADAGQVVYGAITDETSPAWDEMKNTAGQFKMPVKEHAPLYNFEGIKDWKDLADPKRLDLSPDAIYGTFLQLGQSVGEMLIPAGGAAKAIKGAEWAYKTVDGVRKLSAAGKIATAGLGSFLTNITETRDIADRIGLKGRDMAAFTGPITMGMAAVDVKLGIGTKLLESGLVKQEKDAFISQIAKETLEKSVDGSLTKEAVDEAYKKTLTEYPKIASKWVKGTLGNMNQEGSDEALQTFIQNAGQQLWDKLTPAEKKKFGKDAFDPKSFGEYLSNYAAGAIGSAPGAVVVKSKANEIERENEQSRSIYSFVQKGDEAVKDFKHNVFQELKSGNLTKEQADDAITRINAYKEYNDIVGSIQIDDEKKREAFDKTFQKQNLETTLAQMGDPKKLHPLKLGEYNGLEKQANELQKDIDAIIHEAQVKKETTVSEKTVDDLEKKEQPEKKPEKPINRSEWMKAMRDKYKPQKNEPRTFEQLTPEQYNTYRNPRFKHEKTADWLEKQQVNTPRQGTVYGTIDKRHFGDEGNRVFEVEINDTDGKRIRFASSMIRPDEHVSHAMIEHGIDKGMPVGIKVINLDTGLVGEPPRRVIKAFRMSDGKFLGWMKETNNPTGTSDYSDAQADLLAHLQTINEDTSQPGLFEDNHAPENTPVTPIVQQGAAQIKQSGPQDQNNVKKDEINPEGANFVPQAKESGNQAKESSVDSAKPASGDNKKTGGSRSSAKSGKTGIVRAKQGIRKIKSEAYLLALRQEAYNPYDLALQYFIRGGTIGTNAIQKLLGSAKKKVGKEISARKAYARKDGPSMDGVAHILWEDNPNLNFQTEDYRNALEEAVLNFEHPSHMAADINKRYNKVNPEEFSPPEIEMNEAFEKIEDPIERDDAEEIIDKLEEESDEKLNDLANDKKKFDDWEEGEDIIRDDGTPPPFQKQSSRGPISQKVVETIQKNFPKVKVVYDETLEAAGQLKGNTIRINPYYAGYDTPIHEAAHVFLDAMGENKVLKVAIEQLRETDLWKETIERYPELDDRALANEVLAEAIGREGAGIFKEVSEQNKFMTFLRYIFDWLKRNLGLEKNVAKNLARQIISGIGTKNLIYESDLAKNQIIGEKGVEFDKDLRGGLSMAKRMMQRRDDPQTIHTATGWEIGKDGKWKYDLIEGANDFAMTAEALKPFVEAFDAGEAPFQKLGLMFAGEKVFQAYPQLKEIEFDVRGLPVGTRARYDGKNNTLSIDINYAKAILQNQNETGPKSTESGRYNLSSLRSSIVHEIQHAVQILEGFDRGSSPRTANQEKFRELLREKYDEDIAKLEKDGDSDKAAILRTDRGALSKEDFSYEAYEHMAGEVEARNVEARLLMSDQDRKTTPLSKTEDKKREWQLLGSNDLTADQSDFEKFQSEKLDRSDDLENLRQIDIDLKDPGLSKEEREELVNIKDAILEEISQDKETFKQYRKDKKKVKEIAEAKDLEKYSFDELVDAYHLADKIESKDAKLRLAVYLNNLGVERLNKIDPKITERAKVKNLTWIEKWNKVLSNISEHFPPLQELHKIFEERYLGKIREMNKTKANHEKLAKAVIKERNGMLGSVSDWFTSNSAKYFNYLDNNGKLKRTSDGMTKAQKEYWEFFKDLVDNRNEILDEDGNIVDNTLIKIDKGFWETFKSEGFKEAMMSLLPKQSEERINWSGTLTSRFDREYKGSSYSKDFYKAANLFIEDVTHVKYMKDLVPVVDGIELFYKNVAYDENKNLDNLIGFIQEWKKSKLYQEAGEGFLGPKGDLAMRFLRSITSLSTMAFNVPANIMNVVIGNANILTKGSLNDFRVGNARLVSPKGMAILRYYDVIKTDYDSNPKMHIGKVFQNIAFAGLRVGEVQIQGSQFLGKLSEKEWDSFELKDGELEIKTDDKKAFDQTMTKYHNEVSDIQGKYSEKDKSNTLNYEFGKAIMQFKIFLPSLWKDKFGGEFINSYGEVKHGTASMAAFRQLGKDWKNYGYIKGTWQNEDMRSNLKYVAIIAAFTALAYADDDDKEKRKKAFAVDNALHQMMFVFDLQQAKYMVTSPIAAQGPITKLIDAVIAIKEGNTGKAAKNAQKLIPFNKLADVPELIGGK